MKPELAEAAGVVVAHPGRQHSYQVALAAQEYGLLRAFATGFYIRRAWMARALTATGKISATLGSIGDSFHPELDSSRIKTFSLGRQVTARALKRVGRDSSLQLRAETVTTSAIARWLFSLEPRPAIVHTWEGGGLEPLRAARSIGAATVLDVASAHEWFLKVMEEEAVEIRDPGTSSVVAERELADVLLAPSDFVVECLVEHGVLEARIVKVPYGVDPDRFTPAVKREAGVFRVLFVGSSNGRKGLRYLLEAWDGLDLPDAELIVAGASEAGRRPGRQSSSCRFLGYVPSSRIVELFALSDVFVLPSLAEGSALVTYEAMAAGLPVVATPNAGSVVEDGVHGFLVPPRNVESLRSRILELYENPERRRELGSAARALILSRYTFGHYRARIAAVYRAVIENRDPAEAVSELDREAEPLQMRRPTP